MSKDRKNRKHRRADRSKKKRRTNGKPSSVPQPFAVRLQDELNRAIGRACKGEKNGESTIATVVNALGVAAAVHSLRIGVGRDEFVAVMSTYHEQVCASLGVDPATARPLDEQPKREEGPSLILP